MLAMHMTYELGLGIGVRLLQLMELIFVHGLVWLLGAHELLLGLGGLRLGGSGCCGSVCHIVAIGMYSTESRIAGETRGGWVREGACTERP